jgi:two-component system cell cycle response regulator
MMKILVAEDDLTSRTILTSILQKWDFEPIAAEDGDRAWQIMQSADAPNLAVLDWDMPGLDGLKVCRRIRARHTENPPYLIILAAKGEKSDIVKGLEAGANDYISKPYDNDELQARINVGRRMAELQTELLAAKDILAHQAMHDALTGALNRRAILDALDRELNRSHRNHLKLSVGLCDIDHFKQVNDTHGHQVGDDVLCGFVQTIQSAMRKYDCLGRYGGEEFLVVAPDSSGFSQEGLYDRLRAQVADLRTMTPNGEIGITVSIGVAAAGPETNVDTLLAAADEALYRAKNEGRNRVVYAADN